MSIVLYQYKILKEKNCDNYFYYDSNDIDNTILKSEIEKLNNFSSVLRKQNQELFREMLQSSYKYSNAINAKGEEYSTESLIMSLLLERYK
jgi:hypothetical protein